MTEEPSKGNFDGGGGDPVAETLRRQSELAPLLRHELAFDFARGRQLFLSDEGNLVEASVAPICSQGALSGTCQWAWVHPELEPVAVPNAASGHDLAARTGLQAFACDSAFPADDGELRELLARVVIAHDGLGLVSRSEGQSTWSFLVTAVEQDPGRIAIDETRAAELLGVLIPLQAVAAFNQVRAKAPRLVPDFSGCDLRGDPQAWKGDLHARILLDEGMLSDHQPRVLEGIDFSGCRLDGANLRGVSLRGASFRSSSLADADLTGAVLEGADFSGAFLNGANFTGARFGAAGFAGAELGKTLLVDTDLSGVTGLDQTNHSTSSEISFSTLVKSGFQISETFLRATGVSVGLLDDLRRGKRFGGDFSTCFLSYSTKNSDFARQLFQALQAAGVRVFFDCKNVDAAEPLETQLLKAIREHDRMITVFSDESVHSPWLRQEVKASLYYKPAGFTPIRTCGIETIRGFVKQQDIRPDIVDGGQARLIVDFSGWQDEAGFATGLDQLLKSLRR